jgi:hypothetical protein
MIDSDPLEGSPEVLEVVATAGDSDEPISTLLKVVVVGAVELLV